MSRDTFDNYISKGISNYVNIEELSLDLSNIANLEITPSMQSFITKQ